MDWVGRDLCHFQASAMFRVATNWIELTRAPSSLALDTFRETVLLWQPLYHPLNKEFFA